jgi:hypothetical protein
MYKPDAGSQRDYRKRGLRIDAEGSLATRAHEGRALEHGRRS